MVHSSRRGSRDTRHIGPARGEAEPEVLEAVARRRLAAGQGQLDLRPGLGGLAAAGHVLADGHLLDALGRAYDVLGFGRAGGGKVVVGELVLARIIEPASTLGSLRMLEEPGVAPASYATLKRACRPARSRSGMSKHDLQARPVYHHLRDSIEAHLTIVSAAQPASRWIERCDRVAD